MKKPKTTILDNGMTIITVPTDSPSLTVMTLVGTGSKYENKDNNGISHFLEHMCFKGTTKKTGKEIMRYLDSLGAETNAFTSYELTGYYVKSIKKHWKKTLSVVADIFLNSTFPDEELQKEKGVILGEISMYEDIPMRHVHDIFMDLVYADQPAGRTILGPRDNITNMQREDFITYHAEHYVAEATTLVVSGDVLHKDVVAQASKEFKNISTAKKLGKQKTISQQKQIQLRVLEKKTDQTHMVLGYQAQDMYHKDAAILKLMGVVLGGGMSSRLFEKLREDMGVGYYVRAHNSPQTDAGIFEISCGVDSNRVVEVLKAIQQEILRLVSELVNEDELKKAKEYLIGNTYMGLESTDDLAYYYGQRSLFNLGIETPKTVMKKIAAVSSKDIKRVAKKIFKNEFLNIAMIGPHDEKQQKSFKRAARL